MKRDIYDFQESIETKKDFEEFLKKLIADFKENKTNWENDCLHLYLDGLYGYNYGSGDDSDEPKPSWKLFAEMLLAAKVYE